MRKASKGFIESPETISDRRSRIDVKRSAIFPRQLCQRNAFTVKGTAFVDKGRRPGEHDSRIVTGSSELPATGFRPAALKKPNRGCQVLKITWAADAPIAGGPISPGQARKDPSQSEHLAAQGSVAALCCNVLVLRHEGWCLRGHKLFKPSRREFYFTWAGSSCRYCYRNKYLTRNSLSV